MATERYGTQYGYFDLEADEYVVTAPHTPLPWANVICPGKYGVAVSAAGDGFSWYRHAGYNAVTRWVQDFARQEYGRFLYLREGGEVWSASHAPCKTAAASCRAAHGFGYTRFSQRHGDIESRWWLTVDPETQTEVWELILHNHGTRPRLLTVVPFVEWCLGRIHPHHRQIHECFLRTGLQGGTVLATRGMWEIPSSRGHWNVDYPYVAFLACSERPSGWQPSKRAFLGPGGSIARPRPVFRKAEDARIAGSNDACATLELPVELPPGGGRTLYFMLGLTRDRALIPDLKVRLLGANGFSEVRRRVKTFWEGLFSGFQVETPEASLDLLVNQWLKYQVFSSRIFGRSGYWIQGGGYGYREIQDLLPVITLEPGLARERLLLYAQHQHEDLSTPHYFDKLTGEVGPARWSDDALWLPFVTVHYLKETGDASLLDRRVPYLGSKRADPLYEHCTRGIDRVLGTLGRTGLPKILGGDWNDGLSAVGVGGEGESVWLGHFLAGVLRDFCELAERRGDGQRGERYAAARSALVEALNDKAWDGRWYRRARRDDGRWIGTRRNRAGRIFLNAQVWAILSGVVPDEDWLERVLSSLEAHLYTEQGPVLLAPPYSQPDPTVGYLSRYNPGVRENGGVYTHAANWALQAEAMLGRREQVWRLYEQLSPILRAHRDPDRYRAEPYVTSGSIEHRPSPTPGKGGWSWYTSSAAWFFKVLTEWMLGIRPTWDGLEVCPVVPETWPGFSVRRTFRGCRLNIEVLQEPVDAPRILLDGEPVEGTVVPASALTKPEHTVRVWVPVTPAE